MAALPLQSNAISHQLILEALAGHPLIDETLAHDDCGASLTAEWLDRPGQF